MRVLTSHVWLGAVAIWLTLGVSSVAQGEPNCTCRYKGQSYAVNTCVCLSTSEGPRMACCGLVLNNTSWNFTKKLCPVVERSTPEPGQTYAAWHRAPRVEKIAVLR